MHGSLQGKMKTKFEDYSKWVLNHKCAECENIGEYELCLEDKKLFVEIVAVDLLNDSNNE